MIYLVVALLVVIAILGIALFIKFNKSESEALKVTRQNIKIMEGALMTEAEKRKEAEKAIDEVNEKIEEALKGAELKKDEKVISKLNDLKASYRK